MALHHDLGWDPGIADVIVGTSAGSIAGTLLRAGWTTDDLAAWASEAEPLEAGRLHREFLDRVAAAPMRWRWPVARNPLGLARLAVGAASGRVAPSAALMSALPYGPIDASGVLERFGAVATVWPDAPLWLPAVRMADGRRVVFGLDRQAPLGRAVAASCAIPGMYRPVFVDGHRYIDGGAHSSTNADVLVAADVELAIVIAPMSTEAKLSGVRPDRLARNAVATRLRRECDVLRRRGIDTVVFQPDAPTLAAMGVNMLDGARTRRVVTAAFLATGGQITPELRRRIGTRDTTPAA